MVAVLLRDRASLEISWMPPGLTPRASAPRHSGATAPGSHRLPVNIQAVAYHGSGLLFKSNDRLPRSTCRTRSTQGIAMFRLVLLAHAPTPAQRLFQFPADESI